MPQTAGSRKSVDMVRLAAILELLGSDQEGEALSAARRAHEIVRSNDLTWRDVLTPAGRRPSERDDGGKPASPPETIIVPDGHPLTPPHGSTWRESVRLIRSRINVMLPRSDDPRLWQDNIAIQRLQAIVAMRLPAPLEAKQILDLFDRRVVIRPPRAASKKAGAS